MACIGLLNRVTTSGQGAWLLACMLAVRSVVTNMSPTDGPAQPSQPSQAKPASPTRPCPARRAHRAPYPLGVCRARARKSYLVPPPKFPPIKTQGPLRVSPPTAREVHLGAAPKFPPCRIPSKHFLDTVRFIEYALVCCYGIGDGDELLAED